MPTDATSGPLFTASSPSARLQSCLENRLRGRLETSGSLEYELIWKPGDMPAGPACCRLHARGRRTFDIDTSGLLTGWATPDASAANDGESLENWLKRQAELAEKHGNNGAGVPLAIMALMAGWRTPIASEGERGVSKKANDHPYETLMSQLAGWGTPRTGRGSSNKERAESGGNAKLEDQAFPILTLAGWATPTATDRRRGNKPPREHDTGTPLNQMAALTLLAGWATPLARDTRSEKGGKEWQEADAAHPRGKPLARQVLGVLQPLGAKILGLFSTSSYAETENLGVLSPAHPRWLMGYPSIWDGAAPPKLRRGKANRRGATEC